MLEDYRKYLLGIRNNLIQCGVEFPVYPCMEYRELFELGCNLDSLLWYYSVLEISGSEDRLKGFFLPLGNHFKGKMKKVFYEEFQTFLKDYNKISVRSYLANPKYKNVKNISDIYSNVDENLVKLTDIGVEVISHKEEYVEYGRYLEDYRGDENEFVPNGKFLEDFEEGLEVEDRVEEEFTPNGRFLEDFEVVDELEYVSSGVYLEDFNDSGDFIEEDEEEIVEMESDWIEEDESEESEESDWIEEDESEESEELDLVEEESDWIEEDELEESYCVEEDSDFNEEESDWIEEDESELESDWIEESEESDWIEEDEDDYVERPAPSSNQRTQDVKKSSSQVKKVSKPKQSEKDISDYLQDFTNGLLTSGKRAIIKGLRKLDN